MSRFQTDEKFTVAVARLLREMGHDVLTCQAAGRAGFGIPDEEVLAFATAEGRAVLTFNRGHFIRLHGRSPLHAGIVVCTEDRDRAGQAGRIDAAVRSLPTLDGRLIRVYRPNR